MSWFSRCSWCGGPFNGGNCRHCTNVSFGDEPVYDSNPNSYIQTPDFSNQPSQPQISSLDQFHCFHCKDPLEDGERCQRCTCKWCGHKLREGSCWICPSRDENSSIDAPNSFNDLPNVFTHPPQPQYSCELCGNDSHHGYDCPLRFPLVYKQEPSYNQNFNDNYYPQNSPSFPQQYICCENCGGPRESFQCQPMNQNYFEHNSNYFGFDQPPQYSINHQEDLNQQGMNDMHDRWDNMIKSGNKLIQFFGEMLRLQAANISTHTPEPSRHFNSFYDDVDYEESTIPSSEIVSQIPPSIIITPVLPTLETEDSLIMGNEELSTIPEKELDEVIKSSVKDLVPIPSESEDTFGSDSECDLSSCDDFSPINVSEKKSVTFSNPLFDSNDDFTSSDDESLSDEDVLEDKVKIYSNPLFEFDDEYISSDVNPLFDEVLENIESKDSYVSSLDEPALLVTPLSDFNEDECFDPGGDVDKIELLLHRDPSTPKITVAFILEGFNDEPPLEENDDLFDLESKENEWKKILYDASIDDLMTEDKVFDPGFPKKTFSPTYVNLPFKDRHYLSLTYVIHIFLPYFTYPVESSLPLSFGSEDVIFDPGISAYSFYSLESVAYECPMGVFSSTCFIPNIMMIWGESS
ncbi:hypothetical protein Tco_0693814 [Tanacetum coccineum]